MHINVHVRIPDLDEEFNISKPTNPTEFRLSDLT